MTIEERQALVDTFTARIAEGEATGLCPCQIFPEATDPDSTQLVDILLATLAGMANAGAPLDVLVDATGHALTVAIAWGKASGSLAEVEPVDIDTLMRDLANSDAPGIDPEEDGERD